MGLAVRRPNGFSKKFRLGEHREGRRGSERHVGEGGRRAGSDRGRLVRGGRMEADELKPVPDQDVEVEQADDEDEEEKTFEGLLLHCMERQADSWPLTVGAPTRWQAAK